jgi:hypothetical protein
MIAAEQNALHREALFLDAILFTSAAKSAGFIPV